MKKLLSLVCTGMIGIVLSAQTIENSSHSSIGYIKPNGTIENSSHSTVGYVKSDGTVENSSHSTIGYIKSDGTVENSSHSSIGYTNGIRKEWTAVCFFFFTTKFICTFLSLKMRFVPIFSSKDFSQQKSFEKASFPASSADSIINKMVGHYILFFSSSINEYIGVSN